MDKSLLIMSMLRQNARESLTKMSKRTNIPISTIYDKIKNNEKDMIKKHTSIIDFSKLGFHTRLSLSLKVSKNKRDELRHYLLKHQNVNTIYKINHGYDFWTECIFRNIKEMEEFREEIEEKFKAKTETHYIIDDIKREGFMADPDLAAIT